MANDFSLEFFKEFSDSVDLEYERMIMLDRMEEGVLKDWITELINQNKTINDYNIELNHRLGVSAFSPHGR